MGTPAEPPRRFPKTRWTLVRQAGNGDGPAKKALAELCSLYWYPLYGFVRRKGQSKEDAADLTQAFFARLLEKQDLAALSPQYGRFSSWLLASMTNFLSNAWDKERAQKRGGAASPVPIDAVAADRDWQRETRTDLTPEKLYEMMMSRRLLDRAKEKLAAEYAEAGQRDRYEALKGTTSGEPTERYAELAARLGTTEGNVKQLARKMRLRYGELVRAEVADLVDDPADVDAELARILGTLT